MNKDWHAKNKMPKNPSMSEKITWHLAHAQNCACRPIPESIQAEIKKRSEK